LIATKRRRDDGGDARSPRKDEDVMKIGMRFVVAAAVLGASALRAQDPNAQEFPLVLKATRVTPASDGALEILAGLPLTATLGGEPGRYLAAAVYVSGAATVGDFTFLPEGLAMLGTPDVSGLLVATFAGDPALAGLMISARGYAYDGEKIDETATITIRFL
jgi:hypothetical protein